MPLYPRVAVLVRQPSSCDNLQVTRRHTAASACAPCVTRLTHHRHGPWTATRHAHRRRAGTSEHYCTNHTSPLPRAVLRTNTQSTTCSQKCVVCGDHSVLGITQWVDASFQQRSDVSNRQLCVNTALASGPELALVPDQNLPRKKHMKEAGRITAHQGDRKLPILSKDTISMEKGRELLQPPEHTPRGKAQARSQQQRYKRTEYTITDSTQTEDRAAESQALSNVDHFQNAPFLCPTPPRLGAAPATAPMPAPPAPAQA